MLQHAVPTAVTTLSALPAQTVHTGRSGWFSIEVARGYWVIRRFMTVGARVDAGVSRSDAILSIDRVRHLPGMVQAVRPVDLSRFRLKTARPGD